MMRVKNVIVIAVISALVGLISAAPAGADVILNPGNIPQTDENVLLNTGVSGNPIFGLTNQTGFAVQFSSNELLRAPANGQARIEAVDGAFTELMVQLVGATFTSLIVNLDATINGTVDFTAVDSEGTAFTFNNVAVGGSGSNFFTFSTLNQQRIFSVSLVADVPLVFVDAAQFRIGGAQRSVPDVPEPTMMALFGLGLFGAGAAMRGRRARPQD